MDQVLRYVRECNKDDSVGVQSLAAFILKLDAEDSGEGLDASGLPFRLVAAQQPQQHLGSWLLSGGGHRPTASGKDESHNWQGNHLMELSVPHHHHQRSQGTMSSPATALPSPGRKRQKAIQQDIGLLNFPAIPAEGHDVDNARRCWQ